MRMRLPADEIVEQINQTAAEIDPVLIRMAMQDILHSAHFCTSKQCQEMLRYVVDHSLRNERESLRERVIGIEVFGKTPITTQARTRP